MDFGFGGLIENYTGESLAQIADNQIKLLKTLDYMQSNLGADNFNTVEWDNLTQPIYAKITDYDTVLGELTSEFSVQAGTISAIVEAVGADGEVSAASIVAAVNEAGSEVKINADKIDITGTVKFLTPMDVGNDGSTIISGNRITTGEINASLITAGEMSAARISGGEIDARDVTISHLDAGEIYTGILQAIDIDGCSITSSNGDYEISLENGVLEFSNSGVSGSGRIRYDASADRFNFYSSTVMKLIAGDNLSINAGSEDTLYLGTTNNQTVRIGRVGQEVRIYGTLYVNDQAMTVP